MKTFPIIRVVLCVGCAFFGSLFPSSPSTSQEAARTSAPALDEVLECRSVAEPEARLSCFDQAAGRLDQTRREGGLLIMNQDEIRSARRAFFGFSAPNVLGLLGDGEPLDEIEGPLESASSTREGWVFRMEDGAVWRQVDTTAVNFRVRPGVTARIRRAALGSYMLKVGNNPAIRVKRD